MKVVFSLLFVLISICIVYGALSRDDLQSEIVYGQIVGFCNYKGIRMLPKSSIRDYDTCMKCDCTKGGLDCATLPTAFTVNYPPTSKCVNVRIGCVNKWRRKSNKNRKCPRRWIPKDISMIGK